MVGFASTPRPPRYVIPGGALSDPESTLAVQWGWIRSLPQAMGSLEPAPTPNDTNRLKKMPE